MKEAHQAKVEAQLAEWSAKLDVLRAKANVATADARIGLARHLDDLKALEASGRRHLRELTAGSVASWEQAKTSIEGKWQELSGSVAALWAKVP